MTPGHRLILVALAAAALFVTGCVESKTNCCILQKICENCTCVSVAEQLVADDDDEACKDYLDEFLLGCTGYGEEDARDECE